MSEQRIVKALTGETEIHYHYDAEGRLISETNGATGESIRDYVWLGLTPIASFGAANDNAGAEDCTEDLAELDANIEDRTSRIDTIAARIPELGDLAADKKARSAAHDARIAALARDGPHNAGRDCSSPCASPSRTLKTPQRWQVS